MPKFVLPVILGLVLGIVIVGFSKPQLLIHGGTKIGDLNLSYLTYEEAKEKIGSVEQKPLYFNFVDQSISQSYSDIGVFFDKEILKGYVSNCVLKYFCSRALETQKPLDEMILIDDAKIEALIAELNIHILARKDTPIISFDDITFYAQAPDAKFEITVDDLKSELIPEKIFSDDPLKIAIKEKTKGTLSLQNQKTEELMNTVTSQALLVKYGRQPVYVSAEKLRNLVRIISDEGIKKITIDEDLVKALLASFKQTYQLPITLDEFYAVKAIQYSLLYRAGGEKLNSAVILPLAGNPTTDGKVAPKYIEINKTQQRLYTFENGEVHKIYVVGTGLTAETPTGDNFKILKKNRMSYSYFGDWYLPYMMPVGKFPNGLYFGIHEIPYHRDSAGNIYSRDENTMGSPATGGCIQMFREDVKELWDWAEIGTPVIITD